MFVRIKVKCPINITGLYTSLQVYTNLTLMVIISTISCHASKTILSPFHKPRNYIETFFDISFFQYLRETDRDYCN